MYSFIHTATDEYPVFEGDIRKRHPRVSFPITITPDVASDFGYELVHPSQKPKGDVIEEVKPIKVDDKYYQNWAVRSFTKQELSERLNHERDQRIADGIEYTFPNGQVDRVQVLDRDLTILTKLETDARFNLDNVDYVQQFRSMSNQTYFLTAQEVIDMCNAVFAGLQQIYIDSWAAKDALQ